MVITETEQQRIETRTEDNQLQALEQRASIGEIFDGARRGRQPTGATKELLDHLGMDGNYIPLSMFAMGPVEQRAAATITGDVQGNPTADRAGSLSGQRYRLPEHRQADRSRGPT